MRNPEVLARSVVGLVLVAAVAVPLFLVWRTPMVHARMAESGGWLPDALTAHVGVPLRLRLTSDDVLHGFAVGKLDAPSVDVIPGKVTDVTLLFQVPGTYTFYCTRWCGVNHWRMRGTIEVAGDSSTATAAALPGQPLYAALGIDLDAPRDAAVVPAQKPLASLSKDQIRREFAQYATTDYYRTHAPTEVWQTLRSDPALPPMDETKAWEVTASIWRSNTTAQELADGERLFAQNCAACHGSRGAGDGVFAAELAAAPGSASEDTLAGAPMTRAPANLADPPRMLAASPALLQGKILRGGMGTGMPSWGPILTEEQTWSIVAYLYTFQFEYH